MSKNLKFEAQAVGGRMWTYGGMQVMRMRLSDGDIEWWVKNSTEVASQGALIFSDQEWQDFLRGVKTGEFDNA